MKTPRDLLLARHRDVTPRLDAVRKRVLASRPDSRPASPKPVSSVARDFLALSRAWLLAFRWHGAGLGAAWIAIALLNLDPDPGATASPAVARTENVPPIQLVSALRENRRVLAELLQAPETAPAPPPASSPAAPKRRSEVRPAQTVIDA